MTNLIIQEMKKNMNNIDRIVRVLLAMIFSILYLTNTVTGTFGLILLVLGVVFLFTAITSFCPIYRIFGLSTCAPDKA